MMQTKIGEDGRRVCSRCGGGLECHRITRDVCTQAVYDGDDIKVPKESSSVKDVIKNLSGAKRGDMCIASIEGCYIATNQSRDLKALAESHDRLLEAVKFLRDRLIYQYHENPHSDYFIAIKEAEKL